MGAYALIVAGATTAITDAASACDTWPTCGGQWFAIRSPALAIVWSHRLAAVIVGALVAVTTLIAWRRRESARVRRALAVALALYPVQVAIGAVTAVAGGGGASSAVHLATGVVLFSALVLALAWTLEERTPETPDDAAVASSTGRDSAPAGPADPADSADPPSDSGDRSTHRSGPLATVRAYLSLTKPRLMWLLCLVAAAGMALAAGRALTVRTVAFTLGGGVLAIGASGTFNNVIERDVDRRMERTADRPVAQDRIPARNALAFGAALTVAAVAMFLQVGVLAAALGLVAVLYYSVVYTVILKPNTVQNTVVGGFAGSLPALIGWAAVTGTIGLPGLALAGVIFLWTPAHFYNLALAYKEDYARGGFPMLPVVRGDAVTRKHILFYLAATLLAAATLAELTALGAVYAATCVIGGGVFLWAVVRLHAERTRRAALRSFYASNAYLGAILVAVVLDALLV